MRVNVYAEEMPDDPAAAIEIHEKVIDGHTFTGLRIYLHLPVTGPHYGGVSATKENTANLSELEFDKKYQQLKGPFIHRPGDDDSSAITFWGKRDLREVLGAAMAKLEAHYISKNAQARGN